MSSWKLICKIPYPLTLLRSPPSHKQKMLSISHDFYEVKKMVMNCNCSLVRALLKITLFVENYGMWVNLNSTFRSLIECDVFGEGKLVNIPYVIVINLNSSDWEALCVMLAPLLVFSLQ